MRMNRPNLLLQMLIIWMISTSGGCSSTTAHLNTNIFTDKDVIFKIEPKHDFLDVSSIISDELMRNGYKVYLKKEFTGHSNNSLKTKESHENQSIVPQKGTRIILVRYHYDAPIWDGFSYKLNRFDIQWIAEETNEILASGSFRGSSFFSYADTIKQVVQEVILKAGIKPVGYYIVE